MSEARYRVVNFPTASLQLRDILDAPERKGLLHEVVKAGEWMHSELERSPMEFGESREYKVASKLYIRVGFVASLYAIIGIHNIGRVVFVLKMGWNG